MLERGRILISTYQVPQGHSGVVAFSVVDSSGKTLDTKTLEVARGPLSVSAHIKNSEVAKVEPVAAPAPVPETAKKQTEDLPSLDNLETEDTAVALSTMAKEGGEIPDVTEESLNDMIEAVNTGEKKSSPKAAVQSENKVVEEEDTGLIWRRIEIHGAFVTQSKKGSSYTVIPYYAPEFRSESFFGFGARIGATEWKQEKGKNISAVEGDVHLSFSFRTAKGRFTIQPAYGYHSWSKFGSNPSYGGLFEIKMKDTALSIVGGAHLWTYKKVDYRLATIGLGVEF